MPISSRSTDSASAVRPTSPQLAVAGDGQWFRWADGATVDLRRRRTLQHVLAALIEHRELAPGEPLASAALIARGWPGERIAFESARNRLYVAVNALRELGLRTAIEKRGAGYLISTPLRIERG